jgi:hypothetical protein
LPAHVDVAREVASDSEITVVTGNHYWVDGVGGLVAFGLGALIGLGLHRWNQHRLDRRDVRAASPAPTDASSPRRILPTPAVPSRATNLPGEPPVPNGTTRSMAGEAHEDVT